MTYYFDSLSLICSAICLLVCVLARQSFVAQLGVQANGGTLKLAVESVRKDQDLATILAMPQCVVAMKQSSDALARLLQGKISERRLDELEKLLLTAPAIDANEKKQCVMPMISRMCLSYSTVFANLTEITSTSSKKWLETNRDRIDVIRTKVASTKGQCLTKQAAQFWGPIRDACAQLTTAVQLAWADNGDDLDICLLKAKKILYNPQMLSSLTPAEQTGWAKVMLADEVEHVDIMIKKMGALRQDLLRLVSGDDFSRSDDFSTALCPTSDKECQQILSLLDNIKDLAENGGHELVIFSAEDLAANKEASSKFADAVASWATNDLETVLAGSLKAVVATVTSALNKYKGKGGPLTWSALCCQHHPPGMVNLLVGCSSCLALSLGGGEGTPRKLGS